MKPSKLHSNRKAYNWLLYDIGDKWLEEYSKYYKGTLYDLGCADAVYKNYFLKYCDKYIGVDWSNSFHETKVDIVANLNEYLPIEDEKADTVISFSVLEHLCEPQIFLNETYRILGGGGALVLQVPWMWWVHEAPHDYFRYTPYGLKYMLQKAGFKDIHIQPSSGFFTMWFVKMNYFSLRFIKGSKFRQKLTQIALMPFWYIAQILAPKLDSLHRGWSLETQGFYVVAKKEQF